MSEELKKALATIKNLPDTRADTAQQAYGYLYFNPDTGVEWSIDHPVDSGQVEDAENVQQATAQALHGHLIEAWTRNDTKDAEIERLKDDNRHDRLRLNGYLITANATIAQLTAALEAQEKMRNHPDKLYRGADWETDKRDADEKLDKALAAVRDGVEPVTDKQRDDLLREALGGIAGVIPILRHGKFDVTADSLEALLHEAAVRDAKGRE